MWKLTMLILRGEETGRAIGMVMIPLQMQVIITWINIIAGQKLKNNQMDKQIQIRPTHLFNLLILAAFISAVSSLSLRKQHHRQLNHVLYKDNLEVQNWYYGNSGPLQYRLKIFKIATNNTLDICPITAPFASLDFSSCQNCPSQSPLRNLASSLCQKCPEGQAYNPNSGNCSLPLPKYTPSGEKNGSLENPSNQTSLAPKQIVPNSSLPYAPYVNISNSTYKTEGGASSWDSTQVVSNNDTNKIESKNSSMSNGTINTTSVTTNVTNSSATVNTSTNANASTNTNTSTIANTSTNTSTNITTNWTKNTTEVSNQTSVPVFNSTQPEQPKIFNNTAVQPIKNTTGSNATSVNTTVSNNSATTNITSPTVQKNQTSQGNNLYNCSSTTPFFNAATNKCEACGAGQQYISASNICLPEIWKMNSQATRFIQPTPGYVNAQLQKIVFDHPSRFIKECPKNMPYLVTQNGLPTCIKCNDTQYFAVLTSKCVDGCPQGTIFNKTENICATGVYATNVNASNIVSPTLKYDKWKQQIQNLQKVTSNNVVFCPDSTPFAAKGQCVSCPNDKPYFNIENEGCNGCKEGKAYSATQRRCKGTLSPEDQKQKYSNPSLERMFVNLF